MEPQYLAPVLTTMIGFALGLIIPLLYAVPRYFLFGKTIGSDTPPLWFYLGGMTLVAVILSTRQGLWAFAYMYAVALGSYTCDCIAKAAFNKR